MAPPLRSESSSTWWGPTWRYVVVVLFGVVSWIVPATQSPQAWTWIDLAIGLTCVGLLTRRHDHPVLVALLITAASSVSAFAGGPQLLALVSLATRRRWREVLPVGLVSIGAALVQQARFSDPARLEAAAGGVQGVETAAVWAPALMTLVMLLALNAWGFYIGARRELVATLQSRAETAEREQAMRMAQARLTERARIAREMHDVIAHRMSLVAMHAGALAYREDLSPAQTRETAELIRSSAHQALSELRGVLGVLRDPAGVDGDPVRGGVADRPGAPAPGGALPEPPQPTFAALPALLDEARAAGADLRLDGPLPTSATVPDRLGRAAYRIVQEALTNSRKHAPGLPVDVRVTGSPGAHLRIRVGNPLPTAHADTGGHTPGAGLGLTGLAERAILVGGTVEHVVRDGWFVVQADLPWTEEER